MLDECPRVTFRVNEAVYDQMLQLAQRHGESLSQLCRDAIALLIANPQPYYDMLSARVLAQHKMPTREQMEASQQLIRDAKLVDMSALVAACSPPPPPLHERCERVWHI